MGRGWAVAKHINLHVILTDVVSRVVVFVPKEAEEISMVSSYNKAVEHLFNVYGYCYGLTPEAQQNSS